MLELFQFTMLCEIYSDGSAHPSYKLGAWTAILLINKEKYYIHGVVKKTTHQRMELVAVIKALEHVLSRPESVKKCTIYTDSQYVADLLLRKERFLSSSFRTKKQTLVRNHDLIQEYFGLCKQINLQVIKVKAHLKKTSAHNYNREVDMHCRRLLRKETKKYMPNSPSDPY